NISDLSLATEQIKAPAFSSFPLSHLSRFTCAPMPTYKLTYFDHRAFRGESCRVLFALGDVAYEDVRIPVQQWAEIAPSTPFRALPMLEVDGVKFAQTTAIVRYLAREFGYAGPDNLTSAQADALCDQYADFVNLWTDWFKVKFGCAEGNEVELYDNVFAPARSKNFTFFEKALKKSTTGWLVSTPDLTHADVFIGCGLDMLVDILPDVFDGFPLLEAFFKKFKAHPKLQKYFAERPPKK
ncbi:hypothetical protein PFISCL1PPCAC_12685, partial [Pristionchus fissidentatus]